MGCQEELGQPLRTLPAPRSWSPFPGTASSSCTGDGNKTAPRFRKISLLWFIVFLNAAGIGIFCYRHGRSFPLRGDLIDKAALLILGKQNPQPPDGRKRALPTLFRRGPRSSTAIDGFHSSLRVQHLYVFPEHSTCLLHLY